MKTSQKQRDRLKFIDFMLLYCGSLNRADLKNQFNIASAAATRDLAAYKELAPGNTNYDKTEKTYLAADNFKPIYEHDPNEALSFFVKRNTNEDTLIKCETSSVIRLIRIETLALITRAITQHKAVLITYHSPFSGTKDREFVPHCLVDDGLRWHVRGYCRLRKKFIDLVISRINNINLIDKPSNLANESARDDRQWNRYVDLEIVPHPNVPNKNSIEFEHQMENGCLHIEIRAALAGYFLRRWNIDCSMRHTLKGNEYHLWLNNRQALYGVDNLAIAPGYSINED